MKKTVLMILLSVVSIFNSQSQDKQKKLLMVVSSYGKDNGATRPGYEFDEFSQAYLIFKNHDLKIDVASPKGGKVVPDNYSKDKLYNKTVEQDQKAMQSLHNTISTASIDPSVYDAIYIVGGKGAMFDLPFDPSLQDIILHLYRKEGTILSSVCHGPAAFVNVKDKENYIINGVEMTGFCKNEEDLFGKKWVKEFPFALEDKLVSRGVQFQQAKFMLSKVVVSGKFVTGQNPFSTTKSAEEVVKALGIKLKDRTFYKDEKSIYLIQEFLNGSKNPEWIQTEFKENTESYDFPLLALYGYYTILNAKENTSEIKQGLALTELTLPYFFDQNLHYFMAENYVSLGNNKRAKELLLELKSKKLLNELVNKLLEKINT